MSLAMPAILEEYGYEKEVDVFFTASQKFINNKLPQVKPSGVYIEKDGSVKATFNFAAILKVNAEKEGWVTARTFYMTFQARGKLSFEYQNKKKHEKTQTE